MLTKLAEHNEWANQKVFVACSEIAPGKLTESGDGYDSVLGILNHLVQVENAFFELAHGREPRWTGSDDLDAFPVRGAAHHRIPEPVGSCSNPPLTQSFARRSRSAFVTTDTELAAIAAAAMIGESSSPKKG